MIVRRSTLGGYWVDKERYVSVTEVQRKFPDPGHEFASQHVILSRLAKFWEDAEDHDLPPSCRDTLELWGVEPNARSLVRWIRSDSGTRWLAAAKSRQDHAWMDRGTLLHSFKDELAKGHTFTDSDVSDWLEVEIATEGELSKMTSGEYQKWHEGERDEELSFKEWHDRYAWERPQRAYECDHEEVMPYLLSLNGWWQEERPTVYWFERILLDIKRKVAGTADAFLGWRGRLWLPDFKSQKRAGPNDYNADQLGGYRGMTHYFDPEKKQVVPFTWDDSLGLIVFAVTPEKVYPYELKDTKKAVASFRHLLERSKAKGLFFNYNETKGRNRVQEEATA